MADKKVFRVLLTEMRAFHVDTEAGSVDEAMEIVRERLQDSDDDVTPIEDDTYYTGYQVKDAVEIERKDADLDV
jgi:hypothetical protein